jgi:UDP-N-acetyl-D-mannosaminuronic acid dehydrogenase
MIADDSIDSQLINQNSKPGKICVIGMGYVGIPAAVLLADAGYSVTGIQRRSARSGWKIDWLNKGRCPIGNEPELPEMLEKVVRAGKFRVTDDYSVLKDAAIILIDVQTPTDQNHIPQYESLREVSHQIGKFLQPGQIVIIESTVAPGTTENLVKPILEEESGLRAGLPDGFGLCFSYERVMVGRLIHNIREYPKIVGGIDALSTRVAMDMYRSIVKGGVHGTDPMTSEVAKTVENAYRDVQIAFANEVALLCESLGVDVYDVRKFVNGLPNDPSVPHANPVRNMHFPGAGVGGHCLPKDTWLLMHGYNEYGVSPRHCEPLSPPKQSHENDDIGAPKPQTENCELKTPNSKPYPCSILEDARHLNDWMPIHMVDLLEDAFASLPSLTHESPIMTHDSVLSTHDSLLSGRLIAVLGFAFLENSDDARNTPTVPFLQELVKRGAHFKTHDPYIEDSLDIALKDCDAVVLMTKHDEYNSISPDYLRNLLNTKVIVDGRNLFDPAPFIAAGFVFRGVGKGNIRKGL